MGVESTVVAFYHTLVVVVVAVLGFFGVDQGSEVN